MIGSPTNRKNLVVSTTDERRKNLVVWIANERRKILSDFLRSVGILVGKRSDWAKGNFEFFKWDFSANFRCFSVDFSADCQWITGL